MAAPLPGSETHLGLICAGTNLELSPIECSLKLPQRKGEGVVPQKLLTQDRRSRRDREAKKNQSRKER